MRIDSTRPMESRKWLTALILPLFSPLLEQNMIPFSTSVDIIQWLIQTTLTATKDCSPVSPAEDKATLCL